MSERKVSLFFWNKTYKQVPHKIHFFPGYYMNLKQNPRTLLPKFFGLYCYSCNAKNVRIIVMNNLLPSGLKMHHKFDLKGTNLCFVQEFQNSATRKKIPWQKRKIANWLNLKLHIAIWWKIMWNCATAIFQKIIDILKS